ncbi:OsmC family protein [Brevibacterium sp. UCMA 11752]|uniref:OsmC family protein n=1 Tax=Brevibacterium sp. UCMA 11752 TaxID=2745946 RepID=UPI001F406CC6|nr:OsmC family protein [Brevibacterium sp. UCMA 11752]MCF2586560.1 OsmC family protein [Brevibacterium sp. UCMA 11752]
MTVTTATTADSAGTADSTAGSTVAIRPEDRAERLTAAGQAWNERIAASAKNAQLNFSAKGSAQGSVSSVITAGKHTFTVDEPAPLAGDDVAPNPVEYALGALISCQIVVYRLYAHNLGLTIESLDVSAEGDLDVRGLFGADDSVRPGLSAVRVAVDITGPDSDDAYQELQKTVDAHCPVFDIFTNPTPIDVTVTKKN